MFKEKMCQAPDVAMFKEKMSQTPEVAMFKEKMSQTMARDIYAWVPYVSFISMLPTLVPVKKAYANDTATSEVAMLIEKMSQTPEVAMFKEKMCNNDLLW